MYYQNITSINDLYPILYQRSFSVGNQLIKHLSYFNECSYVGNYKVKNDYLGFTDLWTRNTYLQNIPFFEDLSNLNKEEKDTIKRIIEMSIVKHEMGGHGREISSLKSTPVSFTHQETMYNLAISTLEYMTFKTLNKNYINDLMKSIPYEIVVHCQYYSEILALNLQKNYLIYNLKYNSKKINKKIQKFIDEGINSHLDNFLNKDKENCLSYCQYNHALSLMIYEKLYNKYKEKINVIFNLPYEIVFRYGEEYSNIVPDDIILHSLDDSIEYENDDELKKEIIKRILKSKTVLNKKNKPDTIYLTNRDNLIKLQKKVLTDLLCSQNRVNRTLEAPINFGKISQFLSSAYSVAMDWGDKEAIFNIWGNTNALNSFELKLAKDIFNIRIFIFSNIKLLWRNYCSKTKKCPLLDVIRGEKTWNDVIDKVRDYSFIGSLKPLDNFIKSNKSKNEKILEALNSYSKSKDFYNQFYKYKKEINEIEKEIAKGNIKTIDL